MPTLEASSLLPFDGWQKPPCLSRQLATHQNLVSAVRGSGDGVTKRVTRTRTVSDTQWSRARRPRGRRASIDGQHCDLDYRTLLDVERFMDDTVIYRSRRQYLLARGHRCVKMTLTRRRSHPGHVGAPSLPTSPLTSDIDGVHSDLEDLIALTNMTPVESSEAAAAEDSEGKNTGRAKDSPENADSGKGSNNSNDNKDKKPKGQRDKDSGSAGDAKENAVEDSGNSEEEKDEGDDEEEDDEEDEDDGVVRCVCGERNDGELMIQCEICQVWQHTLCMGIRDEKHIPDQYYCEKCRPEDHPYINSRPRTIVLAEASSIGATTMMRRSAVMAVAKMTAREEYRAAAAAAAIAASVAAAASSGSRSGGSRRGSKKQAVKLETGQTTPSSNGRSTQPAKKGRRNRRQTRDPDEESEGEYDANSGSNSTSDKSSGKNSKGAAKRTGGESASRGKRRRTGGAASKENSNSGSGNEEDEGRSPVDDSSTQLPVLDAKMQRIAKQTGRGRSASSVVKSSSKSLAAGSPRRGNRLAGIPNGIEEERDEGEKKRVQSMPGSPRSPSPSLQSLLLENSPAGKGGLMVEIGDASDGGQSTRTDQSNKRKRNGRSGAVGRGGKHQRLTQSASNSPYISQGPGFGDSVFGADQRQGSRHVSPRGTPAGIAEGDDEFENGGQGSIGDGAEAAGKDDEHAHHRQPKHNFPPIEMEDVDGNTITVPSNMLNSHGQPIYSSVTPETMCKIRYPHNRASLHELNRRAKQLLDWLGKAQSEYEQERLTWLQPLHSEDDEQQQGEDTEQDAKPEGDSSSILPRQQQQQLGRRPSQTLSEAPTSPINPSDWPTDDPELPREFPADDEPLMETEAAAPANEGKPADSSRPRPTLSIMEDLVWRLIRFQETYAI